MKSRCPNCQTVFRITPEQLKARAGKVRCGQCQAVFNALDSLLEEAPKTTQPLVTNEPAIFPYLVPSTSAGHPISSVQQEQPQLLAPGNTPPETHQEFVPDRTEPETPSEELTDSFFISAPTDDSTEPLEFEPIFSELPSELSQPNPTPLPVPEEYFDDGEESHLSDSAAQELGKATGLIMPRETTEIPGYSKWAEGVMSAPISLPAEKPTRWPFILVALLLILTLAGQIVFRFRSEIATTMPSVRPWLASLSKAIGSELPLPRHVELVSIEVSDLQNDPAHGNLLVLNATLRNRAAYGQAFPALELALTDTQDAAIARRVFLPAEYLSPKIPADQPFAANADLAVRLWIEARDVSAAGYRLYVFYP